MDPADGGRAEIRRADMPFEKLEKERRTEEAPRSGKSDFARHRKALVKPSERFIREKTDIFDFKRAEIEKLQPVLVCGLDRKLRISPRQKLDVLDLDPFVRKVTPKSLDHLKRLAGVPNEVHARAGTRSDRGAHCCSHGRLGPFEMRHIPSEEKINFSRLNPQQREAVRQASLNLLMGYADPELLQRSPYKALVDYMLERARNVPTFVGKDLIVCPDEVVEFQGFSALHFDNVIVVGNGRIILGDHTKLHAYQIRHEA